MYICMQPHGWGEEALKEEKTIQESRQIDLSVLLSGPSSRLQDVVNRSLDTDAAAGSLNFASSPHAKTPP